MAFMIFLAALFVCQPWERFIVYLRCQRRAGQNIARPYHFLRGCTSFFTELSVPRCFDWNPGAVSHDSPIDAAVMDADSCKEKAGVASVDRATSALSPSSR